MNHVVRRLVTAMCLPGLIVAATAVAPASASASVPLAALSCPSGWFCFYEETGFGNPRGKLSSCGWQNLADFDWENRIEAAYYHLSAGSASFYEANGTYLFQVSAANRSLSDVGARQNKADKVYRACPSAPGLTAGSASSSQQGTGHPS